MTPKLNVWLLQKEKRHVKGRTIKVLVLRDQHNKIRRVAKSKIEQDKLLEWYEEYNKKLKIEELPVSKELRKKLTLIVDNVRKHGFFHRMMFYGIYKNPKEREWRYRRYECFKTTPWDAVEMIRVKSYFKAWYPKTDIGIFVFHKNKVKMYYLDSSR